MSVKTSLDISAGNFDLYFINAAQSITPEGKESLPQDIRYKLFKGGGGLNKKNTTQLSFFAKLFVLLKAARKRWYIVVEDAVGMDRDQFIKFNEAAKKRQPDIDSVDEIKQSAMFVLGSKELCDTFDYLNRMSASNAYTYIMRMKNTPRNFVEDNKKEMMYIVDFLINYEVSKKKVVQTMGLSPQELYVLMGLYHGGDVLSSSLYNERFRYTYQCSKQKMKAAFKTLQSKGYIVKIGKTIGAKLRITSLGLSIYNDIIYRHVLNFS